MLFIKSWFGKSLLLKIFRKTSFKKKHIYILEKIIQPDSKNCAILLLFKDI